MPHVSRWVREYTRVVLQSVKVVLDALARLDACKLCTGNADDKFLELIAWREGKFMDQSGTYY